jgi:hypothetical protein
MYKLSLYDKGCIRNINKQFITCNSVDISGNITYYILNSRNNKKHLTKKCLISDIPSCCFSPKQQEYIPVGNFPFIFQFKYIGETSFDTEYTEYLLPIDNTEGGFTNISFTYEPKKILLGDIVTIKVFWNYEDNLGKTISSGVTFSNTNILNWYNNNTSDLIILKWSNIPLSRGNDEIKGSQFKDLTVLTKIIADDAPTIQNNTYFDSLFMNCINFNSNLSNWNTIEVVSMKDAFNNANIFNNGSNNNDGNNSLNWNTLNVNDMSRMFKDAIKFNQYLNFNTKNVMSMEEMFNNANIFNNGSTNNDGNNSLNWNTLNVISMKQMFKDAINFNQNISYFIAQNVTTMEEMFFNATLYNNGDTNNNGNNPLTFLSRNYDSIIPQVTSMKSMFENAVSFNQTIYALDSTPNNLRLPKLKSMERMFYNASLYNNGDTGNIGTKPINWDTYEFMIINSGVTTLKQMFFNAVSFNQSLNLDNQLVTTMEEMFYNATSYNNGDPNNNGNKQIIWFNVFSLINTSKMFYNAISFNQNTEIEIFNLINAESMFYNALLFNNGSITNNGINKLDWSFSFNLTNTISMFEKANSFNQELVLEASNITNMNSMFKEAILFNNGDIGNNGNNPINWNTSNVIDMSEMFNNANSFNQELIIDTSKVTDMSLMFLSASLFNNGDIGNNGLKPISWNTSNVIDMGNMFNNASSFNQELIIDTLNVFNMSGMFIFASLYNNGDIGNNGLKPISWNTSNVTEMSSMFSNASSLNQELIIDTSKVSIMSSMFIFASLYNNGDIGNNGLKPISWNTGENINMSQMFAFTNSFNQELSINTLNVLNMSGLFRSAILYNNGDIGNNGNKPITWNTSNVTNMFVMFNNASSFNQELNINTSKVTDMFGLFDNAILYNNGDIGNNGNNPVNWNTSNVINMSSMFQNSVSFNQKLNINTPKLTNTRFMFNGARLFNNGSIINDSLNPLNLNTGLVLFMEFMFANTDNFNQRIIFNTSNVRRMNNMFNNAISYNNGGQSLKINTSSVGTGGGFGFFGFNSMFENASSFNQSVSYDISNNYWNTSLITNSNRMNFMFRDAIIFNNSEGTGGITAPMGWIINFSGTPFDFSLNSALTPENAPIFS